MPKIIAIVEGKTEAWFVEKTLPKPHVLRPFSNGKTASIEHICEDIADSLEAIGGPGRQVIVLLDREKRDMTSEAIRGAILDYLVPKFVGMKFFVGVSDRHIENWIVADEDLVKIKFSDPSYIYQGDGHFGMETLRRLLGLRSMSYTDKGALLAECLASNIAKSSPSFQSFIDGIDFDWHWLNKLRQSDTA